LRPVLLLVLLLACAAPNPGYRATDGGRVDGAIRDRMDPFRIRLGLNYRY
jgi:hypothetical protein